MVDSTDVTVVNSNSDAQSDEYWYALNGAPIRRLIGKNAAPWGNLPRRSKPSGAFLLTSLRLVAARWEYYSGTRQARLVLVVSEVSAGGYRRGRLASFCHNRVESSVADFHKHLQ